MTLRTVARGAAAALRSATAAAAATLRLRPLPLPPPTPCDPLTAAARRRLPCDPSLPPCALPLALLCDSATAAAAAVLRPWHCRLAPWRRRCPALRHGRCRRCLATRHCRLAPWRWRWRCLALRYGRGRRCLAAGRCCLARWRCFALALGTGGAGGAGGGGGAAAGGAAAAGGRRGADGRGAAGLRQPADRHRSVAITSTPAEGDDYHAGETITVRVTFSETITAFGSPAPATLNITVGTGTVQATADAQQTYSSSTIDFDYVVQSTDADSNGISVPANPMSGNFTHGHPGTPHEQSSLTFGGLAADMNHKVNSTPTIDYDTDDDGFIEIDSLDKLNAMRHNRTVTGVIGNPTGQFAEDHAEAFPRPSAAHGCPDTADADSLPGPCLGYELTADLDFDTDGDGDVDSDDEYPNVGAD